MLVRAGANIDASQGRHAAAQAAYREALALFEKTGQTEAAIDVLYQLGFSLTWSGRLEEAEGTLRRALDRQRQEVGPRHPAVAKGIGLLGNVLLFRGDARGGLEAFQQTLELYRPALGEDHPDVGHAHVAIGSAYYFMERWDDAVASYLRGRHIVAARAGPDDLDVLGIDIAVEVSVPLKQRRFAGLLPRVEAMRAQVAARAGSEHPLVGQLLASQGRLELARDQPARARPLLEEALKILSASAYPVEIAETRFWLAQALWHDPAARDRARQLVDEAIATFIEVDAGTLLAEAEAWRAGRRATR